MNITNERITAHPFFRNMRPEYLRIICESAREVKFKAGETLFREGEPANRFYVIESGGVALDAHDPNRATMPIQTLGAHEVLGWSWLFPPFVWHFRARAVEPTIALELDGGHLLAAAEQDPAFGYDLMKRVAQLVIFRLQQTRKHLLDRATNGVRAA